VLVTGASYRALGVVRSLGRAGVPVCVAASDDHSVALFSRYVRRRLRWGPGTDDERSRALIELAREAGLEGWLLLPTDDEDAALFARRREVLEEHFVIVSSPWGTFRHAYDKRAAAEIATEAGIALPWSRSLPEALESGGPFPLVVKPAFRRQADALPPTKAWLARDRSELQRIASDLGSIVDPEILVAQELIPGRERLSFAALCEEGRVLASLTARRLRQFPIDFGRSSSYVETIEDGSIRHDGERMLRALRLTGMVEVEFQRDPRTSANKLLDVNPRVWGWQSISAEAGVDFPLLFWRMAGGLPIEPVHARSGVRWMRASTDIPAGICEIRSGEVSLRSYLRSLVRARQSAVFAYDDPLPAVLDLPLMLRIAVARRRRGGVI
jgi:predicted ATP-grasp superfamily ATP-dependent carboligase